MENTRKSNIDFSAIAWGAFFILWGITEMFKSLPDGTGTLGIGVILLLLVALIILPYLRTQLRKEVHE